LQSRSTEAQIMPVGSIAVCRVGSLLPTATPFTNGGQQAAHPTTDGCFNKFDRKEAD